MPGPSINPYAIAIGEGGIRWYSIFAFIGFLVAFILMVLFLKRKYKVNPRQLERAAFLIIPISLVGARLWYVLFNLDKINPWYRAFEFWDGGLAIQGGVIFGAVIGAFIFYKLETDKRNVLKYADCILPFILIGQAIGRWGNFFNMEILGAKVPESQISWLGDIATYSHYSFDQAGTFRLPLFFIEFLANIAGTLTLVTIIPIFLNVVSRPGFLGAGYFITTGIIRGSLELYRDEVDILRGAGGVPVSFLLAMLSIALGLIGCIYLYLKHWKDLNIKEATLYLLKFKWLKLSKLK